MLQIYGDVYSGNCYKLILACRYLDTPLQWHRVAILRSETHTPAFLSKNPNGKIPLLELDDGRTLAESNAILNYLASDSALLPHGAWARSQVLQWQFFEQYSHEPAIAVARYLQRYLGLPEQQKARHAACLPKGYKALDVMENQLTKQAYFVGDCFSIADISLYAYTHVAHEGGFELSNYPYIRDWLERVQQQPGHISMDVAHALYESEAQ